MTACVISEVYPKAEHISNQIMLDEEGFQSLLRPECFNGVEARSVPGRIKAKEQTNGD